MKILATEKDGDYIVRIPGEIDHHSAVQIREEIDGFLEEHRPKRLVLDLSATSFMDSSGLGLILGRLRRAEEKKMGFLLVNPTRAIVKILTLAGVDKMIEIEYL